MGLLSVVKEALAYQWNGPPGLPLALRYEWRLVPIRWLGVIFIIPALPLIAMPHDRLIAGYGVVLAAVVYNLAVEHFITRRPGLLAGGYATTAGDSLLHTAMIVVAGGFDTPLYFALFTITISVAMRYGYKHSLGMVLAIMAMDAVEDIFIGWAPDGQYAFRSAFLLLTALLASYLREQANRAEDALQERLAQANRLNEATAKLGASLEFKAVLSAVASAAAHLFGARHAVLEFSTGLDDDTFAGLPVVIYYPSRSGAVHKQLSALCRRYPVTLLAREPQRRLVRPETLEAGEQAAVLMLALPTQQVSTAIIALAARPGESLSALDPDVVDSFIERIALALENASLYRALASRSEALQRAYGELASAHQELLRLDEMKTNFLANVSHELRTPLSSIRSFSELLLSYEDDRDVQHEFLQIINSESERLTRMVSDVLDVMKIDSGNMDWHIAEVDMDALFEDLVRRYEPLVHMQSLALEYDIPEHLPRINGDRDRIDQVIGNLLNNAMKFTSSGSILIRARRVGDELHVAVTDTGIGIAPEDAERVFEKFQQVGPTLTGKPQGTGLGLSICREIVEHHDGHIWLESCPGVGSTFTFSLCVTPEELSLDRPDDQGELAPVGAMSGAVGW